jgi:hypothetical protein
MEVTTLAAEAGKAVTAAAMPRARERVLRFMVLNPDDVLKRYNITLTAVGAKPIMRNRPMAAIMRPL